MVGVYLALLALCFGGAFFFAGSETGFVTWNLLKVSHRAAGGDRWARVALFLMERKNTLLSAVLVGNNLCIVGASLSFLYLYERIDEAIVLDLSVIESPESYFLSPVFVVLAEMLPKSLFRIYSFRLTMRVVPLLAVVYWLTLPVTWLFGVISSLGGRGTRRGQSFVTKLREEMALVAGEGYRRGTLLLSANVFINRVLRIRERDPLRLIEERGLAPTTSIRATDTVGEVLGRRSLPGREEIAVSGPGGGLVGWVSVLQLARAGRDRTVGEVMQPFDECVADESLVACLADAGKRRYVRLVDREGHPRGELDRVSLLRSVFEGFAVT